MPCPIQHTLFRDGKGKMADAKAWAPGDSPQKGNYVKW